MLKTGSKKSKDQGDLRNRTIRYNSLDRTFACHRVRMAEWENSWPEAEAALREAAKAHATALSREKDVMRQATRRAHATEKALRALPAALERALTAESALRTLQEQKGGPVRSAPPPLEGMVSEQAAAAAAAESAEAAAAGVESEAETHLAMLSSELEYLERDGAEREEEHVRCTSELLEQRRLADAAQDARQHELEQEIESLRASATAAKATAQEREEELSEQLARAHAAGAEMEVLLDAERQVGEAARTEAAEREAEVVFAWRRETTDLREALEEASARADTSHRLLCEQVARELDTLGGIATRLRPMDAEGIPV